ncbi:AraC family transcriptional regulator with amidase-like domain [Shimia isoporae]|uniref:AraC family transcriptional regulator with amidase-like domain n=1 Tax=Shimia isoporae TaxID=647720 RepID=A0A4R1N4B7_9RHOB|nr:GlxA family transcriptional regulator [Shimia isoporae]TCL01588.1 AraC family transcriptional regulator with amidase-like domain [Shimia isoporae]
MQNYPSSMQNWEKTSAAPQHIGVLLFEGFSNHCLANTVEPMRAANMLSGKTLYDWSFLSLDASAVQSSSGLPVAPHDRLDAARGDMLVVMPSYGFRDHAGWRTQAALRAAASRFPTLCAMDTGSWLFAEAGLLDGHKATIHWEELTNFAERFPDVEAVRERFVIDKDRLTCSGAMAAFDLVLHLIGQTQGQALALEVAQLFMTRDSARSHSGGATPAGRIVNRALAVMQEHVENPLPIPEIARRAGVTQKTLDARMKAELGASPTTVYRRQRLTLARKLISDTDLSIAEIALRSGYMDPAAMTRAFKTAFGTTPSRIRQG